MEINATKYTSGEVLKFIRENTNLTQKEFARRIKRSEDWQYSNEKGRTRFYFNDLMQIAKVYDLEIIIKDKKK